MKNFSMETDPEVLPYESTVKSRRLKVMWKGRYVTALSQGAHRAYLYPLFTPHGIAVTAEAPVDHPHHQSVSIGIDLFNVYEADDAGPWTGRQNFYTDGTIRGMAPGRIVSTSMESREVASDHLQIIQILDWQGPPDWAHPEGPVVATETRTIDVRPGDQAHMIDIRSQLRPTGADIELGPALHGYFVIRLADGLRVADGATLVDSEGRIGAQEIRRQRARWVDCSGKAAYGHSAGVAVFPFPPADTMPWHLSDWGFIMVNPFRLEARRVSRGDMSDAAVRVIAHDGDVQEARIPELYEAFVRELGSPGTL
ncbi:MAG: DUF6807 family protein [Candidatus Latescibacterota bacterium]